MTNQQGDRQPVGWRPPEPASEATFVPPPPPPAAGQAPIGWPPPSATAPWPPAASGPRTSVLVVLGGVFLLVVGLLTFGMGGLLLLGSALFSAADGTTELGAVVGGDLAGAFAGMFAVVGAVTLLWGVLEMVGALGMFAHRGWGRAIGIVVGVLGLLFWGLSFLAALSSATDVGSLAFTGLLLAGYALTVVALLTGGAHFRRA